MIKGTQDDWYIVQLRDRFTEADKKRAWCTERFGNPRGRDKNGVWNYTWEGYSFKNQTDYVEFVLRWV